MGSFPDFTAAKAARASQPTNVPDPRRKETARMAFRMLKAGVAGANIIATLDQQNSERAAPLSPDVIRDTVLWAAKRLKEAPDAR